MLWAGRLRLSGANGCAGQIATGTPHKANALWKAVILRLDGANGCAVEIATGTASAGFARGELAVC